MGIDKLCSIACRVFAVAAGVLFLAAIVEWLMYNVVQTPLWLGFLPQRFLELAAYSLLPVIVILLRQIREEMRAQKRA